MDAARIATNVRFGPLVLVALLLVALLPLAGCLSALANIPWDLAHPNYVGCDQEPIARPMPPSGIAFLVAYDVPGDASAGLHSALYVDGTRILAFCMANDHVPLLSPLAPWNGTMGSHAVRLFDADLHLDWTQAVVLSHRAVTIEVTISAPKGATVGGQDVNVTQADAFAVGS